MRIGVLELSSKTHYDCVYGRAKIFDDGNNELFLFVRKGLINKYDAFSSRVIIYEYDYNQSNWRLLKHLKSSRLDYLFITTLLPSDLFLLTLLLFKKKIKIYINIHNINRWFLPKLEYSIKGLLKYINITLWRKSLHGITVSNKNMITYLDKIADKKINSLLIPFSIYDKTSSKATDFRSSILKVAIPGIYSQQRRDYFGLINSIYKIPQSNLKRIQFNFLGCAKEDDESGLQILNQLSKLKVLNYNILIYEYFIPERDFELELINSDIIFAPVNLHGYPGETYGTTKDTASTAMMIKYSIPGLIPKTLKMHDELRSSVLDYNDMSNALEILISLSQDTSLSKLLYSNAEKNSNKFTPENIRKTIVLS